MKKFVLIGLIVLILIGIGAVYIEFKRNGADGFLTFSWKDRTKAEEKEKLETPLEPVFKNLGPAPELSGITKWFNGDPIVLAEQQGKVVLVNFWTYSSISSIRGLPHYNSWYNQYKDQGLVVVGVHTPEFTFEKVSSNVETAIKRYAINYPIAQDNSYKTWQAFHNQFWPTLYLIDKNGDIVYTHYGDGKDVQTEKAIRKLLGLEGEFTSPPQEEDQNSKEIHLGTIRLKNFGGTETTSEQEQIYVFPKKLAKDKFALEGNWKFDQEAAIHTSGFGRMRLNFTASKVFMVAQSARPTTLKIYVDGKLQKGVTISESNLYPLFESTTSGNHTIEIEFPNNDTRVSTFSFQ